MAKIIGIAGGSAGGKSTLSDKLKEKLSTYRLRVLHMDVYFKKESDRPYLPSHISGKYYVDDNSPDTIDWDAFHADFDEAAESGEYDIIIAEGLLVLWDEYIRDRLDLKVFVDCRPDERIVRRIARNMRWGQSFEQITNVYLDMVRFRHDQYVEPTKWTADLIVNGSGNTDTVSEMICDHIAKG